MDIDQGSLELLELPEARELLNSTVPARLAYTWHDGTPRVVPIWFAWSDAELVMATFAGAPKLRVLEEGTRVAVTIDTAEIPYRVLLLRGAVQVREQVGIVAEYADAARRYLGADGASGWLEQFPVDVAMTRLAVRPDWVGLLDFGPAARYPSMLSG